MSEPRAGSSTGTKPKRMNKRKRRDIEELVHPYIMKFDARQEKLLNMLKKMYELADNDLVICDRRTGLNDYTMNKKFADKLDTLAKVLVTMSNQCCQKATELRTKISESEDKKRLENEDIFYIEEVLKETEKCYLVQNKRLLRSGKFKTDPDCLPPPPPPKRIPVMTISTDEEDEVYAGDVDTKFMYPRENSIEQDRYKCMDCQKHFRDSQELRNHSSNHAKELYRCLKCNAICRSERSFYNHRQSHSKTYDCPVEDCGLFFKLKTSLTNHMQKHSEDRMHCSQCGKEFKYRQSCIEHEKFRHLSTRTVPCPVCKKMFWTPTSMRSHRSKYHTLVSELYRDDY